MKTFILLGLFVSLSTFAKPTSDCHVAVNDLIEAARYAGQLENSRLLKDAKANFQAEAEELIKMKKLAIEFACELTLQ